jgi:YD repeat-containing protein
MKHITLGWAVFAGILFFSSCSKETSNTNDTESSTLPKTYTEDVTTASLGHVVETFNLSYDGDKRLVSMISTSNPGNKFVYQYNGSSAYTMDLYLSNQLNIHEKLWINSLPLIDSTFQYNDTNDTTTEKYIYNSAKQLIQMNEYDYSTASGSVLTNTTYYTYDNNGNLITEGDANGIWQYEYYLDKPYTLNLSLAYFPQPKYFTKTETYDDGSGPVTVIHTYTFDSSNRLIADKIVADDGGIVIKSYTY